MHAAKRRPALSPDGGRCRSSGSYQGIGGSTAAFTSATAAKASKTAQKSTEKLKRMIDVSGGPNRSRADVGERRELVEAPGQEKPAGQALHVGKRWPDGGV